MPDYLTRECLDAILRERAGVALKAVSKSYCSDARDLIAVALRFLSEPTPARPVPDRPVIVCLCGSCRFRDAYIAAVESETDAGKIVLSVGRFMPQEEQSLNPELKKRLDALHLKKIELADEILVLNVGGYIGHSTANEIAHARKLNKRVLFLEPAAPSCQTCDPAAAHRSAMQTLHECESRREKAAEAEVGPPDTQQPRCPTCDGKGSVIIDEVGTMAKCDRCHGAGRINDIGTTEAAMAGDPDLAGSVECPERCPNCGIRLRGNAHA